MRQPNPNIKIGDQFGSLIVIEYKLGIRNRPWVCECKCGNIVFHRADMLLKNKNISCKNCSYKRTAQGNITHNMTHKSEYIAWQGLKDRCYNPNNIRYKDYGNRGIKVCDRWLESFEKK